MREFIPETFLQYFCAGFYFNPIFMILLSLIVTFYILLFTKYYWLVFIYACWVIYDMKSYVTGIRRSNRFREWFLWEYMRQYFSGKLVKTIDICPKRNYIFCSFPHGVLGLGAYGTYGNECLEFSKLFPGIVPHFLVASYLFFIPGVRERLLASGARTASKESFEQILGQENGGNCAGILVGGISEALFSEPGKYKFFIKNRKGFIRMALKYGAPLVPVISFGEIDVYDKVGGTEGSMTKRVYDFIHQYLKIMIIIPSGRFLWIPYRHPIITVVGRPVDVDKISEPSQEEVNRVHAIFIEAVKNLFEDEKHKYVKNPHETFLEIV